MTYMALYGKSNNTLPRNWICKFIFTFVFQFEFKNSGHVITFPYQGDGLITSL